MAKKKNLQETKALQIFEGSIRSLQLHLQLMDRALTLTQEYAKMNMDSYATLAETLSCTTSSHPQLNVPSKYNDISRCFTTSRKKVHEQAIIDLYRHFANYIRNIIEEFTWTNPLSLLATMANDKKSNILSFDDIIKCGDYNSIIIKMSEIIFRRFENERSTPKLLQKIISYADIKIDDNILKHALMYLELRHLIIHNNTKADENYTIQYTSMIQINKDNKIPINFKLSSQAILNVCTLCKEIDSKLIMKNMVRNRSIISTLPRH